MNVGHRRGAPPDPLEVSWPLSCTGVDEAGRGDAPVGNKMRQMMAVGGAHKGGGTPLTPLVWLVQARADDGSRRCTLGRRYTTDSTRYG